jgi:hypothetical protein
MGEYTAASAYEAQFLGAYPMFRASSIWQADNRTKVSFFCLASTARKDANNTQSNQEELAM